MKTEVEIRAEVERLRKALPSAAYVSESISGTRLRGEVAALEWILAAPVSTAHADEPGEDEIVEAMAIALCKLSWPDRDPRSAVVALPRVRYLWQRLEVEARAALTAARPLIARSVRESALREAAERARQFVDTAWTDQHPAAGLTASLIVDAIQLLISETPQ